MTYLSGNFLEWFGNLAPIQWIEQAAGGAEQQSREAASSAAEAETAAAHRVQWQQSQVSQAQNTILIGGAVIIFSIVGIWFVSKRK